MTDAAQSARKRGFASGSSAAVDRPSGSLGAAGWAAPAGGAGARAAVTGPVSVPRVVIILAGTRASPSAQQDRTHEPGQPAARPWALQAPLTSGGSRRSAFFAT